MSKTLLRKIQEAATDSTTDLPTLLRMCKVLASRLRNPTLKAWVDAELNGYAPDAELPAYRVFRATSRLSIINELRGTAVLQIPRSIIRRALGPDGEDRLGSVRLRIGVAEIAVLSETDAAGIQWSIEAAVAVAKHMTQWDPLGAQTEISRSCLIGVLDTVRTRVLNVALELEEEDSSLGEESIAPETPPSVVERVQQIVNQTIYVQGNYATIAAPLQQARTAVIAGDAATLRAALVERGLSEEEAEETTALVKQEKTPDGALAKLKALGGKLALKAAEAGVVEAIKQFFA